MRRNTKQEQALIRVVGKIIDSRRREKEISREELAKKIGYQNGLSVYLIEKGRIKHLDVILLRRIERALELEKGYLTSPQ